MSTPVASLEPVIGLEVHLRLPTRTKLFCDCPMDDGRAGPNTHTCPVCLGMPGALPVPNGEAVRLAVRLAVALGASVRERSRFARKHYFYPDLAKGYQISQHELPLAEGGGLPLEDGAHAPVVPIRRLHLEEDAAKSLHGGAEGGEATLVDFDRAGAPLVELVTEPAIDSPREAERFLRRLRSLVMFLGVNDGNLEDGSFRCDANVSLRPRGDERLGTRVELKNLNSFKFVARALRFEVERQRALIERGERVVRETRAWDEARGCTVPMRGKEDAEDYRYVPDPDLPALSVPPAWCRQERERVVSTRPEAVRARWRRRWGFREQDADVLSGHPGLAAYVDRVLDEVAARLPKASAERLGRRVANFVQAEVLRDAKSDGLRFQVPVEAAPLAELLAMLESGRLRGPAAKRVYRILLSGRRDVEAIVASEGLSPMADEGALREAVRRVVASHPEQAAQFRAGRTKVLGFFMGQVMRATEGRADPGRARELLREALDDEAPQGGGAK